MKRSISQQSRGKFTYWLKLTIDLIFPLRCAGCDVAGTGYGVKNVMTASSHLEAALALLVVFPSRKELSALYVRIGQIASTSNPSLATRNRLVPQY